MFKASIAYFLPSLMSLTEKSTSQSQLDSFYVYSLLPRLLAASAIDYWQLRRAVSTSERKPQMAKEVRRSPFSPSFNSSS